MKIFIDNICRNDFHEEKNRSPENRFQEEMTFRKNKAMNMSIQENEHARLAKVKKKT